MSILSAGELRDRIYRKDAADPERIFVVPSPASEEILDASIDLSLGNSFIVTRSARFSALEALAETTEVDIASYQERVFVPFHGKLIIHPGTFILGATWQYVGLPEGVQAQVLARSTWGRAGLTVATAVAVHPGFVGCLTLELVNHGNAPVALYPGARVAQMVFMHVDLAHPIKNKRSSVYSAMTEPAFSKLHNEAEELRRWKRIGEHVSFS
jgi:dCTP deaminase